MNKIYLLSFLLLACGQLPYATVQATHGAGKREVWFKSAVELENQIRSWGITLNNDDKSLYISTLGGIYGSPDVNQLEVLLTEPTSSYVLALDIVANWLSGKLLYMQRNAEAGFMFNGSNAPADTNSCYTSDSLWCDYADNIALGMYSLTTPPNSAADYKRIMHNIQDIGDFLGITIDNLLLLKKAGLPQKHIPQYIMEEIFIPHLQNTQLGMTGDYRAWQKVVYVLLMSGQFFMKLNIERN